MAMDVEFGLDTFGDVTRDADGRDKTHAQVLRDLVEQGVAADAAGVDVLSIGEHHRADFAVSSPEVVLAAIAARTTRLRLGSGVTVLSSDDPVRVFQRFSTLDGLSGGRAEIIAGRGSFIESYPLFGLDLRDYDRLFEEKLDLLLRLTRAPRVTWAGTTRSALQDQAVFPTADRTIPVWVGVGGSPESVVRAVRYGAPLMLAIIGGPALRFRPFVDLYHRAADQLGVAAQGIGVHSPGHVAATDAQARAQFWAGYKPMHDTIGAERGWPPMTPADMDREIAGGAMYVGSPETVARKIAATVRGLGLSRFQLKYSAGPLPHTQSVEAIGLYGERVIPMVQDMLATDKAA